MATKDDFVEYIKNLESIELRDRELIRLRDETVASLSQTRLWFSKCLVKWNDLNAKLRDELVEDINDNSPFYQPVKELLDVDEDIILNSINANKVLSDKLSACLLYADTVAARKQEKVFVAVFGKPKTEEQKGAFNMVIYEKLLKIKALELKPIDLIAQKVLLHRRFGTDEGNTEDDVLIDQLWRKVIEEKEDVSAEEAGLISKGGETIVEEQEQDSSSETETG